ncbi:MAG TPA: bifunctional folylpolyglutamate synthase/dihydrofolate synthase, partial [Firmicutes bacterium]|nr:bifunctional folylpolyglutamate synthase/dihydrofolate synthase [Bacillota bacterium]
MKRRGFPWKKNDLEKGFAEIYWPGRMEYLPGPPSIIMDGAHNLDGMSVLARGLRRLFPGKEIQAVVGILDNR